MFDNLVVSAPKKQGFKGWFGGSFFSTVVHLGLIWAAVQATMKGHEVVQEAIADTNMIFVQEQEQEPEPEPEPEQQVIARLDPPPQGFQTLSAPVDIPTEIPPIDLTERFDPRDFTGEGVEGGIFEGVEGGTGPVDLDQTFLEAVVDERPQSLSCRPPTYPPMLQQAGITGTVLFQMVIQSDGRVDPNSIEVLSTDHQGFVRPGREALRDCLYRPGRIRGQAVAVLVQQPFTFNVNR